MGENVRNNAICDKGLPAPYREILVYPLFFKPPSFVIRDKKIKKKKRKREWCTNGSKWRARATVFTLCVNNDDKFVRTRVSVPTASTKQPYEEKGLSPIFLFFCCCCCPLHSFLVTNAIHATLVCSQVGVSS